MITVRATNNTAGTLTYSNESITINSGSTISIPANVLINFSADPSVVSDINANNLILGDNVSTYSGSAALQFLASAVAYLNSYDKYSSGTISALNGSVTATTDGASTVVFSVSGTFVATFYFKGIKEDGTQVYLYGNSIAFGTDLSAQNYSVGGTYVVNCAGYSTVALAAEAYTSGTISVGWTAGDGVGLIKAYQPTAASFQATARINDGNGNAITSTAIAGTAANKQPIDTNSLSAAASRYFTGFSIQQSATTAANSTVFSMRNAAASTKTVFIEYINCRMGFNATNPVTRTQQTYGFQRFTTATPTGGTALTAGQGDSSDAASQVTDIRFLDTGLTVTSVVFSGNNLSVMAGDTTQGIANDRDLLLPPLAWKLAPGEGLAIRLGVAAVVGQTFSCNIGWREQ